MGNYFNNEGELDDFFNFIDDQLRKLQSLQSKETMQLAAIWLEKPINGKVRYCEGDHICLDDNDKMIESDYASHKILGCYGTLNSSILEMMVINVINDEVKIVRIKG